MFYLINSCKKPCILKHALDLSLGGGGPAAYLISRAAVDTRTDDAVLQDARGVHRRAVGSQALPATPSLSTHEQCR